MKRITKEALPDVEARVRDELKNVGFGILTEIDVQKTLKEKIDVDRPPYRILGACNPKLANQGLNAESDLGVLLPCNVVLYEEEGHTVVSAMKPTAALSLIKNNDKVAQLAKEAESLVWQALEKAVPDPLQVAGVES